VELLDGEHAREQLSRGLGFSKPDRDEHVRRLAFVADLLSRNGVHVVVAAISPYRAGRAEARALMDGRFVEIHVRASVDACARRDVKGLYRRAMTGEIADFTGVSAPYEEPLSPELVVDTEIDPPRASAAKVLAFLEQRG
jgi:adenylyl-sulfate kinase